MTQPGCPRHQLWSFKDGKCLVCEEEGYGSCLLSTSNSRLPAGLELEDDEPDPEAA